MFAARVPPGVDDGYSARDLARPGIDRRLRRLVDAEADVLAVARLDRLSRSAAAYA